MKKKNPIIGYIITGKYGPYNYKDGALWLCGYSVTVFETRARAKKALVSNESYRVKAGYTNEVWTTEKYIHKLTKETR